ncbi:unnamed protein product [Adineta steineri]|uniref:Potassium channel domain-containing protein n=1 Tax=Adineta steineri TaxID=433720 RepID=A0A814GGC9_9BILA|nr:unnamed protein product [Adineta steineri]CAF1220849.1 unnamed protein product [Adineta steineri]
MSTTDNLHSSDILCNKSHSEASLPLTTIVLIPDSTPPVSNISSFETTDEINNEGELNPLLNKRRRSTRTSLMADVSRRLYKRKVLYNRLREISNIMCVLGISGVILMIIENEITFMNIKNNDAYTCISERIKLIISITTMILVNLVFYYHRIDLDFYAVNNSLDHWRIGLTGTKIFLILFEVFICMIHPFPRCFRLTRHVKHFHPTEKDLLEKSYIAFDVALGLPMFARVYLICRLVTFHSHLVADVSLQALGYFNQVSFDFLFLTKTYLTRWPTRSLLVFCTFIFFMGSWSLRACDYRFGYEHVSMLDSMWLFIMTFTTVGYGDLKPSRYCGRAVAAITALIGVLSTALLISILAQKLELTRSEKYVHNFVVNIGLGKERRIQAANIIKYAIKRWYLNRKHQSPTSEYIKIQRRLYRSIHFNQRLKREQKKVIDSCIGLPELITAQQESNDKIKKLMSMEVKVDRIEKNVADMNKTMNNIRNTLDLLLNKIS